MLQSAEIATPVSTTSAQLFRNKQKKRKFTSSSTEKATGNNTPQSPTISEQTPSTSFENYQKKRKFSIQETIPRIKNLLHRKKHSDNDKKHYSTTGTNSTLLADNNTTPPTTLNPTLLKKWTKEEVCSLLCTDEEEGGAGLTETKVQLLYDSGFGTSIANIISTIKEYGKKDAVDDCLKSFPTVARDTMVSVVNWVDNLLKTRLYHLWSVDQVISHLCAPKYNGGAGLCEDQIKPFRAYLFDGEQVAQVCRKRITIEQLLKNFTESGITIPSQFEKTCKSVVIWIMDTLRSKDQITITPTFKKIPHYVPMTVIIDETVMDDVDRKHLTTSTKSKAFSEEELLLLEELSGMPLKALDKAQDADSFVFELKNREETIEKVINGIRVYNQRCCSKQKMTKQDIPFLIAEGGSGSGKSRILVELVNILRNSEIADEYKSTKIIYFNFTNGFNIEGTLSRDQKFVSMITARIVYSAFCEGKYWATKLHGTNNNMFFYEVLGIIGKKLHNMVCMDWVVI